MGAVVCVNTKSHGGWVDGWVETTFPKPLHAAHAERFLGWATECSQLAWVELANLNPRTVEALQRLVDRYLLNQIANSYR
jgi:hypothetical protein